MVRVNKLCKININKFNERNELLRNEDGIGEVKFCKNN